MAVSMIAAGSMGLEIVVATLFLNFRHFLMSSSISQRLKFKNPILKPFIGFFVTDETFSVASFTQGPLTEKYMLAMEVTAYLGWVTGTATGFALGSILPVLLQKSMAIGLYALFISLLIPEIKKTNKAFILAGSSGLLNALLVNVFEIQQGWSIVVSIILISSFGVLIYEKEERFYE
jgi:predicted branched-subunit amino acid permease